MTSHRINHDRVLVPLWLIVDLKKQSQFAGNEKEHNVNDNRGL